MHKILAVFVCTNLVGFCICNLVGFSLWWSLVQNCGELLCTIFAGYFVHNFVRAFVYTILVSFCEHKFGGL